MSVRHTSKRVSGFAIHTLANEALALSMAPEIGGRVVSLRDLNTGREWLDGWSPAGKRRIWHPTDPADYETSSGAGIDECLPTVLPCRINRKSLPDHGDLWNQQPHFDTALAATGTFFCRWTLKSLPLAFERRISLKNRQVHLAYRLGNLAGSPTPFLWAWHPLFTFKRGDQIRFPACQSTCLEGGERIPWPVKEPGYDLSRALFPKDSTPAAKVFLGPLSKGGAEIQAAAGSRLILSWPAELFPYAGLWITRGFWKGLHHWAIEPTNAPVDRLSEVKDPSPLTWLGPREVREWSMGIQLA